MKPWPQTPPQFRKMFPTDADAYFAWIGYAGQVFREAVTSATVIAATRCGDQVCGCRAEIAKLVDIPEKNV